MGKNNTNMKLQLKQSLRNKSSRNNLATTTNRQRSRSESGPVNFDNIKRVQIEPPLLIEIRNVDESVFMWNIHDLVDLYASKRLQDCLNIDLIVQSMQHSSFSGYLQKQICQLKSASRASLAGALMMPCDVDSSDDCIKTSSAVNVNKHRSTTPSEATHHCIINDVDCNISSSNMTITSIEGYISNENNFTSNLTTNGNSKEFNEENKGNKISTDGDDTAYIMTQGRGIISKGDELTMSDSGEVTIEAVSLEVRTDPIGFDIAGCDGDQSSQIMRTDKPFSCGLKSPIEDTVEDLSLGNKVGHKKEDNEDRILRRNLEGVRNSVIKETVDRKMKDAHKNSCSTTKCIACDKIIGPGTLFVNLCLVCATEAHGIMINVHSDLDLVCVGDPPCWTEGNVSDMCTACTIQRFMLLGIEWGDKYEFFGAFSVEKLRSSDIITRAREAMRFEGQIFLASCTVAPGSCVLNERESLDTPCCWDIRIFKDMHSRDHNCDVCKKFVCTGQPIYCILPSKEHYVCHHCLLRAFQTKKRLVEPCSHCLHSDMLACDHCFLMHCQSLFALEAVQHRYIRYINKTICQLCQRVDHNLLQLLRSGTYMCLVCIWRIKTHIFSNTCPPCNGLCPPHQCSSCLTNMAKHITNINDIVTHRKHIRPTITLPDQSSPPTVTLKRRRVSSPVKSSKAKKSLLNVSLPISAVESIRGSSSDNKHRRIVKPKQFNDFFVGDKNITKIFHHHNKSPTFSSDTDDLRMDKDKNHRLDKKGEKEIFFRNGKHKLIGRAEKDRIIRTEIPAEKPSKFEEQHIVCEHKQVVSQKIVEKQRRTDQQKNFEGNRKIGGCKISEKISIMEGSEVAIRQNLAEGQKVVERLKTINDYKSVGESKVIEGDKESDGQRIVKKQRLVEWQTMEQIMAEKQRLSTEKNVMNKHGERNKTAKGKMKERHRIREKSKVICENKVVDEEKKDKEDKRICEGKVIDQDKILEHTDTDEHRVGEEQRSKNEENVGGGNRIVEEDKMDFVGRDKDANKATINIKLKLKCKHKRSGKRKLSVRSKGSSKHKMIQDQKLIRPQRTIRKNILIEDQDIIGDYQENDKYSIPSKHSLEDESEIIATKRISREQSRKGYDADESIVGDKSSVSTQRRIKHATRDVDDCETVVMKLGGPRVKQVSHLNIHNPTAIRGKCNMKTSALSTDDCPITATEHQIERSNYNRKGDTMGHIRNVSDAIKDMAMTIDSIVAPLTWNVPGTVVINWNNNNNNNEAKTDLDVYRESDDDNDDPTSTIINNEVENIDPDQDCINTMKVDIMTESLTHGAGYHIVSSRKAMPNKVLCYSCGSGGDQMIHCVSCAESLHFFCIDVQLRPKSQERFVCRNCSKCELCTKYGCDLRCIKCHRGYHLPCVDKYPPSRSETISEWVCHKCAMCLHCGIKAQDAMDILPCGMKQIDWSIDPWQCGRCSRLSKGGHVCPECSRAYQAGLETVECHKCTGLVHRQCVGLTEDEYEMLTKEDAMIYECRKCQGLMSNLTESNVKVHCKSLVRRRIVNYIKNIRTKETQLMDKNVMMDVDQVDGADDEDELFEVKSPVLDQSTLNNSSESVEDYDLDTVTMSDMVDCSGFQVDLDEEPVFLSQQLVTDVIFGQLLATDYLTSRHMIMDILARISMKIRNCQSQKIVVQVYNNLQKHIKILCNNMFPWVDYDHCMDTVRHAVSKNSARTKLVLKTILDIVRNGLERERDVFSASVCDIEEKLHNSLVKGREDFIIYHSEQHLLALMKVLESPVTEADTHSYKYKMADNCTMTSDKDIRRCALCASTGDDGLEGRLIYGSMDVWVHVNCALWSDEVYEKDDGALVNVDLAIQRGRRTMCNECGQQGATVRCCAEDSLNRCHNCYHFNCAFNQLTDPVFTESRTFYCSEIHDQSQSKTQIGLTDILILRRIFIHPVCDQVTVPVKDIVVTVGNLRIDNLGTLRHYSDSAKTHLCPVNYKARRLFWSITEPDSLVMYTMSINDEHIKPKTSSSSSSPPSQQVSNQTTSSPQVSLQTTSVIQDSVSAISPSQVTLPPSSSLPTVSVPSLKETETSLVLVDTSKKMRKITGNSNSRVVKISKPAKLNTDIVYEIDNEGNLKLSSGMSESPKNTATTDKKISLQRVNRRFPKDNIATKKVKVNDKEISVQPISVSKPAPTNLLKCLHPGINTGHQIIPLTRTAPQLIPVTSIDGRRFNLGQNMIQIRYVQPQPPPSSYIIGSSEPRLDQIRTIHTSQLIVPSHHQRQLSTMNSPSILRSVLTDRPRIMTQRPIVPNCVISSSGRTNTLTAASHLSQLDGESDDCVIVEDNVSSLCSEPRHIRETHRSDRADSRSLKYAIKGFISTRSPKYAWSHIIRKLSQMRTAHGVKEYPLRTGDGWAKFGIDNECVVYLIEQMLGAFKCYQYEFKYNKQEVDRQREQSCVQSTSLSNVSRFNEWTNDKHNHVTKDPLSFLRCKSNIAPKNCVPDHHELSVPIESDADYVEKLAIEFRVLKSGALARVKNVVVCVSDIHGRGLFAGRDFGAHDIIIEYVGEIIRSTLSDVREAEYKRQGMDCYMFRLDKDMIVDSTYKGNAARFINHSCQPNCYSKVVKFQGQKHIIIIAQRRIYKSEELTYDYRFPIEEDKMVCLCGSSYCRKYLN